jgi:glycolate oxidase iron-sulfur subunit
MQTQFTDQQRLDPDLSRSELVIRRCVHCGFCTATCPTYVLLGDELDSPRGRIYLIKEMLEKKATPTLEVVSHIDRCLSCMACMTTCPSDVNYMHLIDHARVYIENNYDRPWRDRFWRWLLASVLPYRRRFAAALTLGRVARPVAKAMQAFNSLKPAAAMLELVPAPRKYPQRERGGVTRKRGAVLLLEGCAEPVLMPHIRESAVRLLNRAGYEVLPVPSEACCGSLVHHLGMESRSKAAAKRMVDLWSEATNEREVKAILTTVSGCGTTLKNYGFILQDIASHADRARQISSMVCDVAEFFAEVGMPPVVDFVKPTVAYHAPCSLQHAQKAGNAPRRLLADAGFDVREIRDAHLCCGSAGVYNILQPEIAGQLRERKVSNIVATGADVVATSNIGCSIQLAAIPGTPVLHVIELLDWATGGPEPPDLPGCWQQSAPI